MAQTDKLAGYRGDPRSNVPEPVEDRAGLPPSVSQDIDAAARQIALAQPVASPLITGDRTPAFVDRQREALAKRHQAERAAERKQAIPASHVPFIDGDDQAIPGALPVESEPAEPADPDAAAAAREQAEADATAAEAAQQQLKDARAPLTVTPAPKPYLLKVDGNQFSVSYDELLRYAEVDPADAEQFSEPSLVRIAQKQIAASNRLAEANTFKDKARQQAQEQPPAAQPTALRVPQRKADPAVVSALDKALLGETEDAARVLQEAFDTALNERLRQNVIEFEYTSGVSLFAKNHPDIISDPGLSSAHIALVAREIADDVRSLGLVNEAQHAEIATNPRLAADILTAARAERRQVREPIAIFEAAFDKLAAMGVTKDAGETTPPPAPPIPTTRVPASRIAEKRALMPQLARSGVSHIGTGAIEPAPADDRIAVHSAAIQKIRKARFQPTS